MLRSIKAPLYSLVLTQTSYLPEIVVAKRLALVLDDDSTPPLYTGLDLIRQSAGLLEGTYKKL